MNPTDRLRGLAVLLAVLSVLGAVGAAATAGVVQSREDRDPSGTLGPTDEPGEPAVDYSGWKQVAGVDSGTAAATYQVPGGSDWVTGAASEPVSYRNEEERPYVSGHAASFYYGNACTSDGARFAGAWAVLGDAEKGSDLDTFAVESARRWARGFGAADNNQAPVTLDAAEKIELTDGTPAVSVRAALDMSVFASTCFDEAAELTVVVFADESRIKSLVVARYLDVEGGLGDEEYAAILGSLEP